MVSILSNYESQLSDNINYSIQSEAWYEEVMKSNLVILSSIETEYLKLNKANINANILSINSVLEGDYNYTIDSSPAIISSKRSGFNRFKTSFIPLLSS